MPSFVLCPVCEARHFFIRQFSTETFLFSVCLIGKVRGLFELVRVRVEHGVPIVILRLVPDITWRAMADSPCTNRGCKIRRGFVIAPTRLGFSYRASSTSPLPSGGLLSSLFL